MAPRRDLHADWGARRARKRAVEIYRAEFGDWCRGYGVEAHAVTPPNKLTADHPRDVIAGGDPYAQPYAILCAACNARKGRAAQLAARGYKPKAPKARRGGQAHTPRHRGDIVDLQW